MPEPADGEEPPEPPPAVLPLDELPLDEPPLVEPPLVEPPLVELPLVEPLPDEPLPDELPELPVELLVDRLPAVLPLAEAVEPETPVGLLVTGLALLLLAVFAVVPAETAAPAAWAEPGWGDPVAAVAVTLEGEIC